MNLSKKIGVVMFLIFISITTYFVVAEYISMKSYLERENLNRLEIISSNLALQIDGDKHENIIKQYIKEDELVNSEQDSLYNDIHQILKKFQLINGIETDIYTLFFENNKMQFGVTSGDKPYFRHEYKNYPRILKNNYKLGAVIEPYGDDHGHWISAFSPIVLGDGTVVGVVQVDKQLDVLYDEIMDASIHKFVIASILLGVISILFFYFIKVIEKEDCKKRLIVEEALCLAEKQKKKIQDSINYAQKIQQAILPTFLCVNEEGVDVKLLYRPKYIVSGDFPWRFCKGNKIFIASVDCTGHGVPGAMMSFVGHFLLNYVSNTSNTTPASILNELNNEVKIVLQQDSEIRLSNDGMDVGLLMIDKDLKKVLYAGARRPVYQIKNNEIIINKGTSKSIGGKTIKKLQNRSFENIEFNYNKGDRYYIFSDGVTDQFDENGDEKFGAKRLKNSIDSSASLSKSVENIDTALVQWQGKGDQTDDILLIGIEL